MGVDIAFWIFAIVAVGAALAVVCIKDLFRAALCLIICFFAVAGLFITLNADLLAGLQVLVYVGAIALLILFGVMMTKDAYKGNRFSKMAIPALILSVILMGTMIASVADKHDFASNPTVDMEGAEVPQDSSTAGPIGQFLFAKDNGYLLAFEITGVLLLAAVIGAMVLAREREKK